MASRDRSVPMAVRRPKRALVVSAPSAATTDAPARALAATLEAMGVTAIYIGEEGCARRIAQAAAEQRAEAVELCLAGSGGVVLLRELLRELIRAGRRDVSIVVHKVDAMSARPRRGARPE